MARYCDQAERSDVYMGSNAAGGGVRYAGPFKSRAQREMEADLMLRREPGHAAHLTECCYARCGKSLMPAEALLCTRCRSVIYCCAECQRADWAPAGRHRKRCGDFLPGERWPYTSRDFRAYVEHWGRLPTARPTPAERASDEALRAEIEEDDARLDAARREYAETVGAVTSHLGEVE